jgi:hypothetical protein
MFSLASNKNFFFFAGFSPNTFQTAMRLHFSFEKMCEEKSLKSRQFRWENVCQMAEHYLLLNKISHAVFDQP